MPEKKLLRVGSGGLQLLRRGAEAAGKCYEAPNGTSGMRRAGKLPVDLCKNLQRSPVRLRALGVAAAAGRR